MSQYAVEGEDYAEVNMVESTNFYMNWENFAANYREEYCQFSGIDPATCVNYTESDMVENVWGGRENAEATKYRVGPLCSNLESEAEDSNILDECGEGCGEGSCCIEWNFFQINDPELPYFKNLGITSEFVRKTCSTPKSNALMAKYAVDGEDYVEVNMVESTNFYMNWEDFAPTYRAEYCEFSGIDPVTCSNYTENDMVEKVWGGKENAEATKYRVGPLCSRAEKSSGDCCFRYGFGARAIPCCLETITCEEHDKLVEDSKENPIAGGAFGKHTTCPKDAAEAHRLISR